MAYPILSEHVFIPDTLAERWDTTPSNVRKMLRDGILRGFKVGTGGAKAQWRILASEVERYEREGAANA